MAREIPTLKLLLIGNSNVGKSSLLLRFTDDTFLPQEEVSATIGNLMRHTLYPSTSFNRATCFWSLQVSISK